MGIELALNVEERRALDVTAPTLPLTEIRQQLEIEQTVVAVREYYIDEVDRYGDLALRGRLQLDRWLVAERKRGLERLNGRLAIYGTPA